MAASKSSKSGSQSSSSSSESADEKPSVTLDQSVTETEAEEAPPKARALAGMWTWPCPRHFFETLADRQNAKVLKPADASKEDVLAAFKQILQRKGYLHGLLKAAVADEPHKHWQPNGLGRERHKHLIFLFRSPFVHAGVRKAFAEEYGYHGFFTFHRAGWAAYLDYLLTESAKKPLQDLDRSMVFFPASLTMEKARAEVSQMSNSMAGRRKNDGLLAAQRKEPPKRRKKLTFSELTDFVVERKISTVGALWEACVAGSLLKFYVGVVLVSVFCTCHPNDVPCLSLAFSL